MMLSKVRRVFTKEYIRENAYYDFMQQVLPRIKLKNESESVCLKIKRLRDDKQYKSDFRIKVGEY